MEVFLILWRSWHSIYFLHHWKNISQYVTSWMHSWGECSSHLWLTGYMVANVQLYNFCTVEVAAWSHLQDLAGLPKATCNTWSNIADLGIGGDALPHQGHTTLHTHQTPWETTEPGCAMDTCKQMSGHYNHSTYSLWRESDSWGKPCCISTKRFCLLFLFRFWVLSCYCNCFLGQGALMTKFDIEVHAYQNLPVQLVIILCRHKVQGLARYRCSTAGMAVVPLICSCLVYSCCY